MKHRVECDFWVPLKPEDAFDFFGDIHRLDELTPRWFRLTPAAPANVVLAVGSRVDYRLRWRGVPTRWQSLIRVWERPRVIVYEQGHGLFHSFRHEHFFEPANDGTRVVDRIFYDSPGGDLVRRLIVEPDLRRVLEHRRRVVIETIDL